MFEFKKGDLVSIKKTTLTGVVLGVRLEGSEDKPVLTYRVNYEDVDGVAQERFFLGSELQPKEE